MFCLGTERIIQNLVEQNHPFRSLAVRSTIVLWSKCARPSKDINLGNDYACQPSPYMALPLLQYIGVARLNPGAGR